MSVMCVIYVCVGSSVWSSRTQGDTKGRTDSFTGATGAMEDQIQVFYNHYLTLPSLTLC